MTPGAVAAILYSRCRRCDPTFLLESEPSPDGECFILTASWAHQPMTRQRTYSSVLSLGHVRDLASFLEGCVLSLDRRADRA